MNSLVLFKTVIFLSIKIGLIATCINFIPALAVSFLFSRKEFHGKALAEGFVNLPLVLPPVTTGYILLILLGKRGVIGSALYKLTGISIAFSGTAAVIASMVVSFPLIVRSIKLSLDMIDRRLELAAMTLGASPLKTFMRITLPLILPGILSGLVLAFARSLGEFGATITFAGNIEGETKTIPLAVYSLLQVPGREKAASLLVIISVVISLGAMLISNAVEKKMKRRSLSSKGESNGS